MTDSFMHHFNIELHAVVYTFADLQRMHYVHRLKRIVVRFNTNTEYDRNTSRFTSTIVAN